MRQRNLQRQAIAYGRALFADLKTRPGGTQVNERRLCFLDRFSMRCKNGQNDIHGNVVGIAVEHPVGKRPEVVGGEVVARLLIAPWRHVAGLRSTDGTPLAHVMAVRLHRIGKNRVKDTFIGEIQHVKPNRETEAGRTVRRLDWRKRIAAAQQNTANF